MNENTHSAALQDNCAGCGVVGVYFVNKWGGVTSVITVPPSANEALG